VWLYSRSSSVRIPALPRPSLYLSTLGFFFGTSDRTPGDTKGRDVAAWKESIHCGISALAETSRRGAYGNDQT